MSQTQSERSARLRAGKSLERFKLGRKADNAAALAAKWASKAGTWIGLSELLDFLPESASWRTVKQTIKTWGRAARPSQEIGKKATDFVKSYGETQLSIAQTVLGSTAGQAALTSAGVPPELTAALASAAGAGAAALGGLDPDALTVAAVDAADPMAEDSNWLEDAADFVEEHPAGSLIGLAALMFGGWRVLR